MEKIDLFTLAEHTGPYESWPLKTELIEQGKPTGKKVPGFVLEAQYRHNAGYLLVTSWDCPFEEAQTFLLLSPGLDVLFKKTIGAPYASIWMEGHEIVDESTVLFHCDGNLDIRATVCSAKKLKLEKFDRQTGKRFSSP